MRRSSPALPNSRIVVLRGARHMMMAERPDELLSPLLA
jgi:pimeloyl-ACP methyl ester carboxylesterase